MNDFGQKYAGAAERRISNVESSIFRAIFQVLTGPQSPRTSNTKSARSAIVENKRLDAALEMVAAMQVERSGNAPRRTGQTGHMF